VAQTKTTRKKASVAEFLNAIKDDQVRKDSKVIAGIMRAATKAKPEMYGSSIVGFGRRHSTYASGREVDWMEIAFAPRKDHVTLYISSRFKRYKALMARLGKHSGSKSCVHIKRLSDVHLPTLKTIVASSVKHVRQA
jgi:hypothetical protein